MTAEYHVPSNRTDRKFDGWFCALCDCGREWKGPRKRLIDGNTKSCGCDFRKRKADHTALIGQTFGRLTVTSIAADDAHAVVCSCICGVTYIGNARTVARNKIKSCGCIRGEAMRGRASKRRGQRYVSTWKVQPNELVGRKIGRLRVLLASAIEPGIVVCQCDCGSQYQGKAYEIGSGIVLSCGCVAREKTIARCTKHGMHKTIEYETWRGMIRRCYRNNGKHWSRYGGRGITVCDRWRFGEDGKLGLHCFIEDMGKRPSPDHSIDRVDNDGNYEPANCRWATKGEQALNSTHSTRFGDVFRSAVFGTPSEAARARFRVQF